MPYPAAAIANEFVKLATAAGRPLTPLKLQKLVYFAHGWYLALISKPLINEPVQAWRLGPVIPSLYHAFKSYGNTAVKGFMKDEMWPEVADSGDLRPPFIDDGADPQENEFAKAVVRKVWQVYGGFSAIQLSNLTHEPGSPWSQTPDKDKKRGVVIDENLIRAYFRRQAEPTTAHA